MSAIKNLYGKVNVVFSSEVNYDTQEPVVKENDAYKLLWPIDIETLNKDPELVNNPGYMK